MIRGTPCSGVTTQGPVTPHHSPDTPAPSPARRGAGTGLFSLCHSTRRGRHWRVQTRPWARDPRSSCRGFPLGHSGVRSHGAALGCSAPLAPAHLNCRGLSAPWGCGKPSTQPRAGPLCPSPPPPVAFPGWVPRYLRARPGHGTVQGPQPRTRNGPSPTGAAPPTGAASSRARPGGPRPQSPDGLTHLSRPTGYRSGWWCPGERGEESGPRQPPEPCPRVTARIHPQVF